MDDRNYILAIDLGTQGTKTALIAGNGTFIASAFAPASFSQDTGEIEQRAETIYEGVLATIRQVVEKSKIAPGKIAAIGVDGQMAGVVGIDEQWNPLTPYDSGLDKRCEKKIEKMQALAEKQVIALSGCPIIVAQGAKMYWWKEERPELYRQVRKFVPLSTYVCGRLAGLQAKDAYIDYTHIHLTAMADILKNQWSKELLSLFQFDEEKLPLIRNPWDIIGTLTKKEAQNTGLLEGTPIVAGCGDTPASTLGAGMVQQDMLLDIAGTATALTACVEEYQPDVKNKVLIYPRSVVPGQYNPFGFVLGGQSMDWYRSQLGGKEEMGFSLLDQEARSVSNDSLYFLPFFAGRICPSNPRFSGSWVGMKFYHTRAHMHRSIMEAIAYEYKFYLEKMKEVLPNLHIRKVAAMSGGAKSDVFTQIKCDILGLPYVTLNQKDTALTAAAVIAGYGVGFYQDISTVVSGMVQTGNQFEPALEKTQAYESKYSVYQEIVSQMETLHEKIDL